MSSLPPILLAALLFGPGPESGEAGPDLFPTDVEPAPTRRLEEVAAASDPAAVATTGILLWRASCPWATSTGGCFEWRGRARPPLPAGARHTCDQLGGFPLTHPRRPSQARTATLLLERALGEMVPEALETRPELRERAAAAAFVLAEAELERTLALDPGVIELEVVEWMGESGVPSWELEHAQQVSVAHESLERWYAHWGRLGAALDRTESAYLRVILLDDPHWTLAAMARLGGLYEVLPELRHGPHWLDRIDRADGLEPCHSLVWVSRDRARDQYRRCVDTSRELGHANEHSDQCWAGLARLDPEHFPALSESWPRELRTSTRVVHEPTREHP